MVSFRIGADVVPDLRIGATPVQRLYVGPVMVWQRPAVFLDAFDRSNGSPGGNWATGGSRPPVVRSQSIGLGDIGSSDGSYAGWARFVSPLNTDLQEVSASLVSNPTSEITSVVCRGNSDLSSCVVAEAVAGSARIATFTGGSRTERASASVSWGAGQTLTIRTIGTTYQLLRNGVHVTSWTDSSNIIPAGQRYTGVRFTGYRSWFTNTYAAQLDNWTATDVLL